MPRAQPADGSVGPAGRDREVSGDARPQLAGDAPSQNLLPEPLDLFTEMLPGPVTAQINRQSLTLATSVAAWSEERLPGVISELETELARGTSLHGRYHEVVARRWEDAAEVEALARRRAQRVQDGRLTPLERWGERLAEPDVSRIHDAANARLAELRGKRPYQLARLEADAAKRDPFPELEQIARRWAKQKGRTAAELVACQRRLAVLELVRNGPVAEPSVRDGSASPKGLGYGAFEEHARLLGSARFDPILAAAVAIQPELEAADPAILWALRAEMQEGIAALDGKAAYEAQRLERDWGNALHTATQLLNDSATGSEGQNLAETWRIANEQLGRASERVEELEDGQRLWDKGTHPDYVLNRLAGRIAIGVAANEALAIQRAQQQQQSAATGTQQDLAARAEREVVAAPSGASDGIGAD